jgi:exosortase/archaeosortase family protein
MAAAGIYDVVTPTLVGSREPIIWFGLGRTGAFGLVITPDCSSALLLVPLLTVGVGLMILPRLPIGRIMTGLGTAAAVLVGGNLTRIGIIALAIHVAGIGAGYQLGHLIIGSVVSIVCIAISLALLTAIVTSRRGDRPLLNLLHVLRRPAP